MQLANDFDAAAAAGTAAIGVANAARLASIAAASQRPGRRAAAGALWLVNVALAGEAALYLAAMPQPEGGAAAFGALLLRALSLAAAGAIGALFWGRRPLP